jgi:hypothetical protein
MDHRVAQSGVEADAAHAMVKEGMEFVRVDPLAVSIVVRVVALTGAVFGFARPVPYPKVLPAPPDNDLPYAVVSYT